MLIFVIFIAIGIIIAFIVDYSAWDKSINFGGWILIFVILMAFCAMITTFIICGKCPKQQNVTSSNTICNLSDTTKTKATQFLFRTTIDNVEYYKFYENTDKGATLDMIQCDNTYIVESDKETPRVDIINVTYKTNDWICFDFGGYSYYKIYVPKNTITKDYVIDME